MAKNSSDILKIILSQQKLIFTTRDAASLAGLSISSATQMLIRMERKGLIKKIIRGLWGVTLDNRSSPLVAVSYLAGNHRAYVSFTSALHIYGIISQIPQSITAATTAHSKKIITPIGVYLLHQIEPNFFSGFDWDKNNNFLIASPEKALVDCLYLSSRKGKKYQYFPELDLPKNFDKKKAVKFINLIKDPRLKKSVSAKLTKIF